MKQQKLLELYNKLSEQEKTILRLKALLYFKTPVESVRACCLSLRYLFTDQLTPQAFKALLNQLKSRRLLDQEAMLPPALVHPLTLEALSSIHAKNYLESIEEVSAKMSFGFYSSFSREEQELNAVRLTVYSAQEQDIRRALQSYPFDRLMEILRIFFLHEPLELDWLTTRPLLTQRLLLHLKLSSFCLTGALVEQIPALLAHYVPLRGQKEYESFAQAFLLYDIFSGNLATAEQTLDALDHQTPISKTLQAMVLFLKQDHQSALRYFEEALKSLKRITRKNKVALSTHGTLFYSLALLGRQNRQDYKKIQMVLDAAVEENWRDTVAFRALQRVLWRLQGLESKIDEYSLGSSDFLDPLSRAIATLADYWLDKEKLDLAQCKSQFETYQTLLPLVAKIFAEILCQLDPHPKIYKEYLDAFKGIIDFTALIQMGERWQTALDNLAHFFAPQRLSNAQSSKRLVWYFNPYHKGVEPIEQSLQAKGGWSKGRPLALKRLYELDPKLDYLTEDDQRVIKTLSHHKDYGWYGRRCEYEWDPVKTPLALVGHPCVYDAYNPDCHLELVACPPHLLVKQQDDHQFHLSLSHIACEPQVFIEQETPNRYRVVNFTKALLPLVDILGSSGLSVPLQAKDHLLSVIQQASPMLPIHSEVELTDLPAQAGDTMPCVQLMPLEQGMRVHLLVRPFTDQGPYLRPGHGRESLIIFAGSQQLKANRSLSQERQRADELIKACRYLQLNNDGSDEWILEEPEECLEVLADLQERQDAIKLEWPEGQKMSVTKPVSFEHLSLKINQQQDWFKVKGALAIDEDMVMDMQRLLELLDQSQGRFIALGENRFMALAAHFKKQLHEFKALTEQINDGQRIHALGSLALKSFIAQVPEVKNDQGWQDKLKSFTAAEAYQPKLSPTLQADLRDYQQEGFTWLSRLAYLGLGACLADDMGLGKTLQALAVMLNQAPKGACLVIAPTSVCHNWLAEIKKFTPTLTPHSFKGSNRAELVASLTAMDVLVCSYTLLQQEVEILAGKSWQMIVLDEAQAIKNATTKRFQAAIKLQGQFKLALSGTPIENHLEEIWSLFRFIAPGLLGSREAFQERFLSSCDQAERRRNGLKKLLHVFILRRTKNKVLQDLPPRTEQTILIEMAPEEQSFYEALRRQALAHLSTIQEQRKLHILAEITRLRRACCHSSLAQKDIVLPSSKLKVFLHLVEELLANNHQALVFSQYVGYLELVRQELEAKGIAYQYLDGSTSAQQRQVQVQAFQEGKSPLFLLSLKAGGSGLNLTAADYVIHLDPWWNPAVEDQASDRAHRLGQQRPVTIYRLIMQHTIEEQILALHQAKREMAEDLLEGSHKAEKMSEEQLLKLIAFET